MICARLEGGLGNQLFQYAAARALALHHGTEVLIDASALAFPRINHTPRRYELNGWRIHARMVTAQDWCGLRLSRWLPVASPLVSRWRTYVEHGLEYNAAFPRLPDHTYLIGYWQSPRYFADYADTIAAEIHPVHRLSAINVTVADRIEAHMSVAVHVRRGDYVSRRSTAALHGALSLTYYGAAIEHLRKRLTKPCFYVFSDDLDWCRANLPLAANETTFVNHNCGADAWQDLVLMAHCRHHIIANSSFSWWGAWLADQRHRNTSRHVIAPARWFANQTHDIADRFPPHWRALP